MALPEGERSCCPEPDCGCEIEVTKSAAPGKGGDQALRCCCGMLGRTTTMKGKIPGKEELHESL